MLPTCCGVLLIEVLFSWQNTVLWFQDCPCPIIALKSSMHVLRVNHQVLTVLLLSFGARLLLFAGGLIGLLVSRVILGVDFTIFDFQCKGTDVRRRAHWAAGAEWAFRVGDTPRSGVPSLLLPSLRPPQPRHFPGMASFGPAIFGLLMHKIRPADAQA